MLVYKWIINIIYVFYFVIINKLYINPLYFVCYDFFIFFKFNCFFVFLLSLIVITLVLITKNNKL
ncbi:hypothetical protein PROPEN_01227 [Proteus penneri ATCC 35198]|nr:hypothetical protein PROPEN_01227 [Proteus penneri ATCC 35198]